VDFFLLDREAVAAQRASRAPTRRASTGVAVSEGRFNYPACTYCTPNTNFFIKKRQFLKKSCIFCTPVLIVLRIHLFAQGKAGFISKNTNCGSTSPSCIDQRDQLQKFILATGSCSFKALTTTVLYGHSFNNFVALHADVLEKPVSCTSHLRDFLGEVSSLAPMASNVFSVSTVCFLSGFLCSNDPVVLNLLTR
jgi:hypothetical protein